MSAKILLVEDDPSLTELIKYNLEQEGYDVTVEMDGEEGLLSAQTNTPDLILLDWMLPNLSGIEICRRIRRENSTRNIPVIMLTARSEENDRIRGLDTGADDYITKPFSPRELIARIKAMFRRIRPALSEQSLGYAGIEMDLSSRKITRDGLPIHLGPTEFNILKFFMENPCRVFSREQLLDMVWGNDIYVEARTIDVHIRRLRKALNEDGKDDIIRTVRSAGYSLDQHK
ncbi:MAG: phosphate regulon transcriptional regulator PhoB [Kordiimonadaceae bacterium]|jgi:two-component system, OmpR family, phosphate regulon response regulator PhoB|nr:phosphate regulon transcriptional regulator PhoB [Kordiimonadaceae bacterium]MBT6036430.1 phosphate regulon transcriptional regulator PhoB [Kordiimonadaceae bacterium]MBT6328429.1 phosphate regulon transcriptional regulator PhoB [Kordiimonadaceae bacterium]MBT7583103.1 phosphate regulon transcriptional regulator PhoB [Kordiimonadaceae bacterium]